MALIDRDEPRVGSSSSIERCIQKEKSREDIPSKGINFGSASPCDGSAALKSAALTSAPLSAPVLPMPSQHLLITSSQSASIPLFQWSWPVLPLLRVPFLKANSRLEVLVPNPLDAAATGRVLGVLIGPARRERASAERRRSIDGDIVDVLRREGRGYSMGSVR